MYLDSFALGQAYPGFIASDYEDVGFPRCKRIINSILDMHNIEASVMTLAVRDHSNTTHVTSTGDHSDNTSIESNEIGNLCR